MEYQAQKMPLDMAIKRTESVCATAVRECLEPGISSQEKEIRFTVKDYLFSVHEYLKELKELKGK